NSRSVGLQDFGGSPPLSGYRSNKIPLSIAPMQSRVLIRLAICFVLIAWGSFEVAAEQGDARGTFSNLRYSRQAGDLLVAAIKIVPVMRSDDPTRRYASAFQGALQIAEGAPSEIMIVDIRIDGD